MMAVLTPSAKAEVKRILDGAARRLLDEREAARLKLEGKSK